MVFISFFFKHQSNYQKGDLSCKIGQKIFTTATFFGFNLSGENLSKIEAGFTRDESATFSGQYYFFARGQSKLKNFNLFYLGTFGQGKLNKHYVLLTFYSM